MVHPSLPAAQDSWYQGGTNYTDNPPPVQDGDYVAPSPPPYQGGYSPYQGGTIVYTDSRPASPMQQLGQTLQQNFESGQGAPNLISAAVPLGEAVAQGLKGWLKKSSEDKDEQQQQAPPVENGNSVDWPVPAPNRLYQMMAPGQYDMVHPSKPAFQNPPLDTSKFLRAKVSGVAPYYNGHPLTAPVNKRYKMLNGIYDFSLGQPKLATASVGDAGFYDIPQLTQSDPFRTWLKLSHPNQFRKCHHLQWTPRISNLILRSGE